MLSRDQEETEKALQSLTPACSSEAFRHRIGADYTRLKSGRRRFGNPLVWLSVASAAAASLAVIMYYPFGAEDRPVLEAATLEESVLSAPRPNAGELRRVWGSSELVEVEYGPVYQDENGSPVRDAFLRYSDVEVFERLSDREEITVTTSREEVRKTPVVTK